MSNRAGIAMEEMRGSPDAIPRRPVPSTSYHTDYATDSRGAFASVPNYDEPSGPYHDSQGSAMPLDHDIHRQPKRRSPWQAATHRFRSIGSSLWLAEWSSFLLALATFAAVVVILALYQDKPQPQWPSAVSLNSLISIFTSIFKAALIFPIAEGIGELKWIWFARARPASDIDRFDSASRGPWGSLMLLLRRPGNILASLGALITIVALAIDPFTQQILQYYNCPTPVSGLSATISRSNNYTASLSHGSANANVLDSAMAGAIYQGLLSPPANASASTPYNCPSGNCTFPETGNSAYNSLAMCSLVEDITNLITGDPTQGNVSLPSGLKVGSRGVFLASSAIASKGDSPSTISDSNPFFALEVLMLNVNLSVPGIQQEDDSATIPFAIRAYLYPCVHTYGNVVVSNSVLEEKILSSDSLGFVNNRQDTDEDTDMRFYYSLAGNYPSLPGTDCTPSPTAQGNNSVPTIPNPGGNSQVIVDNTNPGVKASSITWYNPECVYFYGFAAFNAQQTFLGSLLSAQNLTTTDEPAYTADGPLWFQRLYANGTTNVSSATAWTQGLADSMTGVIRQKGVSFADSASAQGVAFGNQTCVTVQWAWLALPAILLLFTFFFLVGTVIQSHTYTHRGSSPENGRGPWKSSSLPLLWGGMLDTTKKRYENMSELHAMREYGEELSVRLCKDNDSIADGRSYGGGGNDGGSLNKRGRWMLMEEPLR